MAGVIGSNVVRRQPRTSEVESVQDGRVLYSVDLSAEEDRIIEVE